MITHQRQTKSMWDNNGMNWKEERCYPCCQEVNDSCTIFTLNATKRAI